MVGGQKVCVVTVNWNGCQDTVECLRSLRGSVDVHIVVVDNGSTDGSPAVLRREFPEVVVLETGDNLGFTGGNNLGLQYAARNGYEFIYFLNNDTTSESDAIATLVSAAEANPSVGLLTPVIHYFEHPAEAWFAGSCLDLTQGIAVHDNSRPLSQIDSIVEVPWASGCALFARTDLISRLGGFDDRFFLNWEDVDLSIRVRDLGFRIGLVPTARVYHKVGKSFGSSPAISSSGRYYHVRNNLLLLKLHPAGGRWAPFNTIRRQLREGLRALRPKNGGSCAPLVSTFLGMSDHLRGRYGRRVL